MGKLLNFHQTLRRQRLLWLLVRSRRRLRQSVNFNFVIVAVHDHRAHRHCNVHILHALETYRVDSVIKMDAVNTLVGRLPKLFPNAARLLSQKLM